jgi:hypothetical protein
LLEELRARMAFDLRCSRREYRRAGVFALCATIGSFAASLTAITGAVPPWIVALVAAIPGTAILLDRSLAPFERARWHVAVETRLQALARALTYEDADPMQISREYSRIMIEMEDRYPPVIVANPIERATGPLGKKPKS